MDDGAPAGADHAGEETAVEADGGEQVGVQLLRPVVLAQCREAPGGCLGVTEVVDEDVQPAHPLCHLADDGGRPLGGGQVGRDEGLRVGVRRLAAGRHQDRRTARGQPTGDGRADTLGASGDQGSTAGQ